MIGTRSARDCALVTKAVRLLPLFIPYSRAAHRFAVGITLAFS
jgi:hypothetical protein